MARDQRTFHVPFPVTCAVFAVAGLSWLGAMQFSPDPVAAQTMSNVGLIAAAAAAAARCGWTARRRQGRVRTAWAMFALACLSWAGGQAVWTMYESVQGVDVPFPSWADVGYLGFVPLTAAGLLALPSGPARMASMFRTVFDGLIIASSVLFISWATVIDAVLRSGSGSILSQVISLAYPVGDVVIITILLFAMLRARSHAALPPLTLALLALGLLSFTIGDSGFAYLALSETYSSGNLIDAGWLGGFLLILLAASRPPSRADRTDAGAAGHGFTVLLPYIPVLLAGAVRTVQLFREQDLDVVPWIMTALMLLLVVRQVLTLWENVALTRNLEERVNARTAELIRSEERFRSLVQNSTDVITVVDGDGTVSYQSQSAAQVFGCDPDATVGTSFPDVVHPEERDAVDEVLARASSPGGALHFEHRIWHTDGRWCDAETIVTNLLHDPSVGGLVLNTRDVTERKQLQSDLVMQALRDPLTDLANRTLLRDRLQHSLRQGARHDRALAVLFLDLDGFKQINDSLGHAYGDRVLIEVAARLQSCVRDLDTVARLGGDEFAVMVEEVTNKEEVTAVAERIAGSLRLPFLVDGHELFAVGSIGIALADHEGTTADDLLRNADLAMYHAKSIGDGGHCWYEPSMHSAIVSRLELEADLRHALERGELSLAYQPIAELSTSSVIGSEALLRWQHPTRGLVSPAEFIPVAESCGIINTIGEWVLRTACRQLRRWQEQIAFPLTVSVNLSAHQIRQPNLVDVVLDALRDAELEPSHLILEMTETVLIEQSGPTLANLQHLKELGVKLAIDDFGTGYSSLSYLHRFPVDIIKIDRSFVDRLDANAQQSGLASSIVQLGQALNLITVAEGIEEHHQLQMLRSIGCDRGQGYLLARPLSSSQFASLLGVADDGPLQDAA